MTVDGVIGWMLGASLASSLLLMAVLLARNTVSSLFGARVAVLLWAAPLLRLVLPPLGFGLLPATAYRVAPEVEPATVPAATPVRADLHPYYETAVIETVSAAPAAPVMAALPDIGLWEGLLLVWLGGAAIAIALRLFETHSWRRTLEREALPTSALTRQEAERAAAEAGYRGAFRAVLTGAAASPQVTGVLHPLIALPADFESRFAPEERRLTLVHEFTHLARGDLKTRFLAETVCALHWFNPLLRLALPRLAADQEAACDEAVRAKGAGAKAYAQTLLRAAKGPAVPALTLNHDLKRRIETMNKPLPKGSSRFFGSVAVAALALGGAAAMQQESNDVPSREDRTMQMAGDEKKAEKAAKAEKADRKVVKTERHYSVVKLGGSSNQEMVLLSDPFGKLTAVMPEMPENMELDFDMDMPVAPAPPAPPTPPVKTRTTEEGTWMLMPGTGPDDAEFEARMEEFGERMEAWAERHEEELERTNTVRVARIEAKVGEFEAVMEKFGEEMGAWGEKMGAVGEAVGDLGDRCKRHKKRSDEPVILSAKVEGSGETVKAVCARGGSERYASEEIGRFVKDNRDLTAEEKAYFEQERQGS